MAKYVFGTAALPVTSWDFSSQTQYVRAPQLDWPAGIWHHAGAGVLAARKHAIPPRIEPEGPFLPLNCQQKCPFRMAYDNFVSMKEIHLAVWLTSQPYLRFREPSDF